MDKLMSEQEKYQQALDAYHAEYANINHNALSKTVAEFEGVFKDIAVSAIRSYVKHSNKESCNCKAFKEDIGLSVNQRLVCTVCDDSNKQSDEMTFKLPPEAIVGIKRIDHSPQKSETMCFGNRPHLIVQGVCVNCDLGAPSICQQPSKTSS